MDLWHHYNDDVDDSNNDSDEYDDDISKNKKKKPCNSCATSSRSSWIQIVTETEYETICRNNNTFNVKKHRPTNHAKTTATTATNTTITAGRWSTHCSCTITLTKQERHVANACIQSTLRMIRLQYPTYSGYCIPLLNVSKQMTAKTNDRHMKSSYTKEVKSSNLNAASTTTKQQQEIKPLHISLTHPQVSLQTHQIDSFLQSIRNEIQSIRHITPFTIHFPVVQQSHRNNNNTYTHCHCRCDPQQQQQQDYNDCDGSKCCCYPPLELFHNIDQTKSFGIWRVSSTSVLSTTTTQSPLQTLSEMCNTVLTKQYQQLSYTYPNTTVDTVPEPSDQKRNHHNNKKNVDPIYHVSLVRFEPCLLHYVNQQTSSCRTTPIATTTTNHTYHTTPTKDNLNLWNGPSVPRQCHTGSKSSSSCCCCYSSSCSCDAPHDEIQPPITVAANATIDEHHLEEDDDTDSEDDDDDDDDDNPSTDHYIDHITCQFGDGAKVCHIPLWQPSQSFITTLK
jgi:Uncharacterised conserved protein